MTVVAPSTLRSPPLLEPETQSWVEQIFPANPRLAIGSMVCVWGFYTIIVIAVNMLTQSPLTDRLFSVCFPVVLVSLAANWFLYRIILFLGGDQIFRSFWLLLTLPTAILALALVLFDRWVDDGHYFFPTLQLGPNGQATAFDAFFPYIILVVWGGIYLAFAQYRTMNTAIVNSRNSEKLTRESQLRALRYQLNPHFIFNALNSVSSLVIDARNREAEQLIDGLADYMRVVLNDEGQEMVTVAKEIEQQVRYLEIEQVRFPNRLKFETQIADQIADWKIPALIVQPLIENAIKHGVARSTAEVDIVIEADEEGSRLKISVRNTGRMISGVSGKDGTGTGLVNVKERLEAAYGASAALFTGNSDDGMAVATIILPCESEIMQGLSK